MRRFALIFLVGAAALCYEGVSPVRILHKWTVQSGIIGLTWSSDGKRIAAASNFGRNIAIWSQDGKPEQDIQRSLSNGPYVGNSLAFLGGGSLMLTPPDKALGLAETRSFSVWDIAQHKVVRDVPGPHPDRNFRFNQAQIFAVSPDESKVAVVSSLLAGEPVIVYSADGWAVIRRFPMEPRSTATALAFTPDGKQVAVGTIDGTVELQSSTTPVPSKSEPSKKILTAFPGQRYIRIGAVAFSPDGKYLAAGVGLAVTDAQRRLPSVLLWRLDDLSLVGSYLPGVTPVRQISWDAKGSHMAVAAGDRTVRIGSPIGPKTEWASLQFPSPVLSLGFSPKQEVLAVASGATVTTFALVH